MPTGRMIAVPESKAAESVLIFGIPYSVAILHLHQFDSVAAFRGES
jgi:hypothetical protein